MITQDVGNSSENKCNSNDNIGIESLLRKLRYKSTHRGCKEMDIILGSFAKEYIDFMELEEINIFTKILDSNDSDIYDWLTQKITPPQEIESPIFRKLMLWAIKKDF